MIRSQARYIHVLHLNEGHWGVTDVVQPLGCNGTLLKVPLLTLHAHCHFAQGTPIDLTHTLPQWYPREGSHSMEMMAKHVELGKCYFKCMVVCEALDITVVCTHY